MIGSFMGGMKARCYASGKIWDNIIDRKLFREEFRQLSSKNVVVNLVYFFDMTQCLHLRLLACDVYNNF